MKVKIIRGIYGYRENGRLVEKNVNSDPVDVSEEEGERLISSGIAKRADAGVNIDDPAESTEEAVFEEKYLSRQQLEDMTLEELRDLAVENGLKKSGGREALIERIIALYSLDEETEEGEEEMPELAPADPE